MTDHTLSAHTHGDDEVDARTVARVVRHTTVGLAVTLAILALIALGLGLAHDTPEAFMLGCTVLVCSGFVGAVSLAAYMVELIMKGQSDICDKMEQSAEDHEEFRQRFAALEAGGRAIAGAVRTISDPPDELNERRRGGH